jgi:DNA mismatch endonuclease, patch repair protein
MRANRRVSALETSFRKALWAQGARGFRRGDSLSGRPDLVFTRLRLAVFVHGCYWHRCPSCNLPWPKANSDFWAEKLQANQRRDVEVSERLARDGWAVEVIWEHDLRRDMQAAAARLANYVKDKRLAVTSGGIA